MALFGKREKAYEVWGDKPRWKEARARLKDAGIKIMETGYYETEAPLCGCGAKLDHRDFGPNGKIDRLTYYISVKPEDVARAKELLAEAGVPVITGPCLTDRSKPELVGQTLDNPALLHRAGVKIAICTDHPETPIQYLPLCAAMAVRGGLDPEEALAAITSSAAEIAGLSKRVGTLTPGKDADVVVTSGHPFDWNGSIRAVFLNGRRVK